MSDNRHLQGYSSGFVKHLVPSFRIEQYPAYVAGCLTFSFGADFFIYSKLGTDPLDVFSLGLIHRIDFMTVGLAQGGFALLCLLIWSFWNQRPPLLSPVFTFFFCGTLIDIWMGEKLRHGANVASYVPLAPHALMFAGALLCAFGSSLIIMSGIGIRSMDLLAITMLHRWKAPFWICKGILELLLLGAGWLLGGPVGIGTLVFLVFVGWLIQPLMWLNTRVLSLTNHGLQAPSKAG